VDDLAAVLPRIRDFGGQVTHPGRELDFRPLEPLQALVANCVDPAGNTFLIWQRLGQRRSAAGPRASL
jgi:predicted enzyme related to lactoylglutathione lyase